MLARQALIALLAPLELGRELMPGIRWVRASSELGLRLTFARGDDELHVEVFPSDPARPHAARSARLLFAYRRGRDGAEVDGELGRALCREVAVRAEANEVEVLGALASAAATADRQRIRELRGGPLLERAGSASRPYHTLSPYVGCLIGCRFCYAQERVGLVRDLVGLPPVPWGSYVDARVDAPEVLLEELDTEPTLPIKLCPIVSDPYQAVEAKLELTRRCLEVLRAAPPRPVFVLSRAALLERDADLFTGWPEVRVGFSIPTLDEEVARAFEPRAAPIADRVRILRALRRAGVRTFAVLQPPLPGDQVALADTLAEIAEGVSIDVLYGEMGAGEIFDRYPEARSSSWQDEARAALTNALTRRGVEVWDGELPGDVNSPVGASSCREEARE